MPSSTPSEIRAAWFDALVTAFPQARGMFAEGATQMPQVLLDATEFTLKNSHGTEIREDVAKRLEELALDLRRTGFPSHEYPQAADLLVQAGQYSDEEAATLRAAGEIMAKAAGEADLAGVPAASAAQVISVEHHGAVSVVRLEAGTPVHYLPGQALPVMQAGRPGVWKGLAPALPENSLGQLEFHVAGELEPEFLAQEGGWVTLGSGRGPGASISSAGVLIVAAGTGLAAAKALVFDVLERAERPQVHLVVGARTQAEVYDAATFAALAASQPWLDLTWVVEDGSASAWEAAGLPDVRRLFAPLEQAVAGAGVWWGREIVVCGANERARAIAQAMRANGASEIAVLAHDAELEFS